MSNTLKNTRDNLLRLIYISDLRGQGETDLIRQILLASHKNNPPLGLSGALICEPHACCQVLEGPSDAVRRMFAKIAADPRHKNVTVMLEIEIKKRIFPQWSMLWLRTGVTADQSVDDLAMVEQMAERESLTFLEAIADVPTRIMLKTFFITVGFYKNKDLNSEG